MFNDARRAMRDMIFKVWSAYTMSRLRKARKLSARVALEPWLHLWKARYQRFKHHGYFYDSGSDDESKGDKVDEVSIMIDDAHSK